MRPHAVALLVAAVAAAVATAEQHNDAQATCSCSVTVYSDDTREADGAVMGRGQRSIVTLRGRDAHGVPGGTVASVWASLVWAAGCSSPNVATRQVVLCASRSATSVGRSVHTNCNVTDVVFGSVLPVAAAGVRLASAAVLLGADDAGHAPTCAAPFVVGAQVEVTQHPPCTLCTSEASLHLLAHPPVQRLRSLGSGAQTANPASMTSWFAYGLLVGVVVLLLCGVLYCLRVAITNTLHGCITLWCGGDDKDGAEEAAAERAWQQHLHQRQHGKAGARKWPRHVASSTPAAGIAHSGTRAGSQRVAPHLRSRVGGVMLDGGVVYSQRAMATADDSSGGEDEWLSPRESPPVPGGAAVWGMDSVPVTPATSVDGRVGVVHAEPPGSEWGGAPMPLAPASRTPSPLSPVWAARDSPSASTSRDCRTTASHSARHTTASPSAESPLASPLASPSPPQSPSSFVPSRSASQRSAGLRHRATASRSTSRSTSRSVSASHNLSGSVDTCIASGSAAGMVASPGGSSSGGSMLSGVSSPSLSVSPMSTVEVQPPPAAAVDDAPLAPAGDSVHDSVDGRSSSGSSMLAAVLAEDAAEDAVPPLEVVADVVSAAPAPTPPVDAARSASALSVPSTTTSSGSSMDELLGIAVPAGRAAGGADPSPAVAARASPAVPPHPRTVGVAFGSTPASLLSFSDGPTPDPAP